MLDLSRNLKHLRWLLKLVLFSIFTSSCEPPIYIPTHSFNRHHTRICISSRNFR
ncbi:hypothetical protein Goshw_019706 [Gossypium schwendimanii]|uniref:Uncharacterized protein n=1 Tax=Gossypium schwendimanii TaxID=34291 RepID=A0A7J9KY50_GOSSC|nr:hypothetical protein [Gossypium schwendimanii]